MSNVTRSLTRTALSVLGTAALFASTGDAQPMRIFGVGYPPGAKRAADGSVIEVPVGVTEERYARFPLTVSVRNYSKGAHRYRLHVRFADRGQVSRSALLEVAPESVRRERYDINVDFAMRWDAPEPTSSPGSLPAPTPIFFLPSNPVRATLRLLSESGAVLDSQAFNLILSTPRSPPRFASDLRVERVRFRVVPPTIFGAGSIHAWVVFRNVGWSRWRDSGDVSAHLRRGTPETNLEDMGAPGRPIMRVKPLPTGLASDSVDSVSIQLEAPLRAGEWYTLTGWTSSEEDLDPRNDAVRLIFRLNSNMSIRESRTERVTNMVRVLTR